MIDPAQAIMMKRKKTRQALLKVAAALENSPSDVAGIEINCGICDPFRNIRIAKQAGRIMKINPMIRSA